MLQGYVGVPLQADNGFLNNVDMYKWKFKGTPPMQGLEIAGGGCTIGKVGPLNSRNSFELILVLGNLHFLPLRVQQSTNGILVVWGGLGFWG